MKSYDKNSKMCENHDDMIHVFSGVVLPCVRHSTYTFPCKVRHRPVSDCASRVSDSTLFCVLSRRTLTSDHARHPGLLPRCPSDCLPSQRHLQKTPPFPSSEHLLAKATISMPKTSARYLNVNVRLPHISTSSCLPLMHWMIHQVEPQRFSPSLQADVRVVRSSMREKIFILL